MLRYEALPPLRVTPSHVVFRVSEKTMRDASVLLLVTDVRKTSGIGIDVIVPDACPLRAEHAEASESDSALVHVQLRWKPGVPLKEGTWNLIIQDRDSTEDAITVPVRVVREIEP